MPFLIKKRIQKRITRTRFVPYFIRLSQNKNESIRLLFYGIFAIVCKNKIQPIIAQPIIAPPQPLVAYPKLLTHYYSILALSTIYYVRASTMRLLFTNPLYL